MVKLFSGAVYELTGEKLSDELLIKRLAWILIPSSGPIGKSLGFIMHKLANKPQVVNRMRDEVEYVCGHNAPNYVELQNMSDTKNVVKEGLRHFPPFWSLAREAVSDDVVDGYRLNKNIVVLFNLLAIHINPNQWEHPAECCPERFDKESARVRSRYSYLPFSHGARACQVVAIAPVQIMLVIARLVKEFDFYSTANEDVTFIPRISLSAKDQLHMQIVRV